MNISWGSFTGGALLGVLISKLLSHLLAKDRAKLGRKAERHNQYVADFKAAFGDALINLHYRENSVAFILQQTFNRHKVAYIQFRDIVPESKRKEFGQLWANYEDYYNQNSKGQLHSIFTSANTEYETQQRMLIVNLIKELMEYAKEV